MRVAISYVEGILGCHHSLVVEMPEITKQAVMEAIKKHVNETDRDPDMPTDAEDSSTWKVIRWAYDWEVGSFIISSEDFVRVYFAGLVTKVIPIHTNKQGPQVGPFSDLSD